MSSVFAIVRRNLRLFFRDRMNVFFSLLGALILFLLYTLFLGNMQRSDIEHEFSGASSDHVFAFVDSWMFAGIVLIATVTTGLGALSALIEDGESGRFRDFLVSPTRQRSLVLGYLLAAIVVALIMSTVVIAVSVVYLGLVCGLRVAGPSTAPGSLVLACLLAAIVVALIMSTVVIAVSVVYLGLVSGLWLDAPTIARIGALTLLCCAAFTALCAFIVSFVRSSSANSALNTVVGTATGFIAAAYIPLGALPQSVANVISAMPFAEAGMLLRREFTASTLTELTGGNAQAGAQVRDAYGIDLAVGSQA